jgi:hypothetical protein
MTEKDREILTPQFAHPRIPHDILFCMGGFRYGKLMDCVEAYDIRADRWIKVSSTCM